jgi:hypothetical protein
MAFKRLYHSVTRVRSVCYSAFGSPNLGITWSIVTLLSGLIYLIYNERKRRNFQLERKNSAVELGNSYDETPEGLRKKETGSRGQGDGWTPER